MTDPAAATIAVNRFGLGARPGELAKVSADPRAWLLDQAGRKSAFEMRADGLVTTRTAADALAGYLEDQKKKKAAKAGTLSADDEVAAILKPLKQLNDITLDEIEARANHGLTTPDSFAERLVYFWSNHFTVSASKAVTLPFAGVFEREVIRAGMTGTFADLLVSSTRHPGMLMFLDQAQSIGPGSKAGKRRGKGLNENLGREILELHTVGPQGGYTQADVTEFAKALTGWSVAGKRTEKLVKGAAPGDFIFIDRVHEPGTREIMGRRYAPAGAAQAEAVLRDLAKHPSTARRIAEKLARHFIADDPPKAAVAALEANFRKTGGELPELHRTLVGIEEAWAPEPRKFKTPNEFLLSSLRLLGLPKLERKGLVAAYTVLGQPTFRAPSPEGWPDDSPSWAGPDALIKRIEWAQALAERVGSGVRPEDLAKSALGAALTPKTSQSIARAESAAQGLTIALMSPEFQRR